MANTFFEDADVLITSQLLKMIMKRSWNGKDGNINRPSLVHGMDSISPFTMLYLNEDELALLNGDQDLLNTSSLVSVEALRLQRCKLKVCIPLSADDFMLMLKRYGNLLFAVFSHNTPQVQLSAQSQSWRTLSMRYSPREVMTTPCFVWS